jgi:hypothetical protein
VVKFRRILQIGLIVGLLLGINQQTFPVQAQPLNPNSTNQPDAAFQALEPASIVLPARSPAAATWVADTSIPDGYTAMAENATFKLYGNQTNMGFLVVDKRSGYVWHSCLDKVNADDRLNKSWRAFAGSGLSLEYLDDKAVSRRISITNSNVAIDYKAIDQGFQGAITFNDFSITIGVSVILEENGVRVEIPASSIRQENPTFRLGLLYVYPFMGATRTEDNVPGYMFFPDGAGSLVRFGDTTKAQNMFVARYYGKDLGMITEMPYDRSTNPGYNLSIPVFGMVHGEKQNGFISIVESGASYGELQMHPAGIITNFNFMHSAFIYNESYFQATNRSGDGVTILQRETNAFDIKIHYRFLTGDASDYVGMALSYQQYLVDKGVLKPGNASTDGIGLRLEFLGAEKQKVLFWDTAIPMTTVAQMEEIIKDVAIPNLDVVFYGWQPHGASSVPPSTLKLDGSLGSVNQLESFANAVKEKGGRFYLYLNPQAALMNESGYSTRSDLAMSITTKNLLGFDRGSLNYYFNLGSLDSRYSSLSTDISTRMKAGLALEGLGSTLYSDFKTGNLLNREQAIASYQSLLSKSAAPAAFYLPNDYMFGFMKAYYDIPLTNNGYIYTTDMVPFLQIVLAGYVPLYGKALNFSSNTRDDLLREAEFDVYPAYFVTHDVTAKILNTNSNWIYTSSYAQWSQDIKQNYQWLNNLLGPVKGQTVVARQVLQDGVNATTYSNGKQIIVNYNDAPYTDGGVTVGAKDALIREVQP